MVLRDRKFRFGMYVCPSMARGNYAAYCIFLATILKPNLLRRLESIRDGNEDIATLHETLSSRKDALCAVRIRLGVPTLDGQPCQHCGAHLFEQESTQID